MSKACLINVGFFGPTCLRQEHVAHGVTDGGSEISVTGGKVGSLESCAAPRVSLWVGGAGMTVLPPEPFGAAPPSTTFGSFNFVLLFFLIR